MATTKPKKTTTKKPAAAKKAAPKAAKTAKKPAVKVAAKPSTNKVKSSVGKKTKCLKSNPCKVIVPIAIFVAIVAVVVMAIVFFCIKNHSMTCTRDEDIEGTTAKVSFTGTFDNGSLTTLAQQFEFENEETATQYCKFFDILGKSEESGVSCEGNVMKFKEVAATVDGEIPAGLSRDGFAAKMEEAGYTCKK